jgi:hypothetical protein
MNAPRNELFATTGLAADQHRAVVAGDLAHELVESVDGDRAPDGEFPAGVIRSDHSLHLRGLLPRLPSVQASVLDLGPCEFFLSHNSLFHQ